MANLFFPQLTSGALAQYPIRKTTSFCTVSNQMLDGNSYQFADGNGSRLVWNLEYAELDSVDMQQLQAHFAACLGPFRAFTFIDPADNMLAWASDLAAPLWTIPSGMQVAANAVDPTGGTGAFTLVNSSQTSGGPKQQLTVPANYQYCFSAYIRSDQGATVQLTRIGLSDQASDVFTATGNWTRMVSTGRLNDSGTSIAVSVGIEPGQEAELFGLQLEAQIAPSRFRPTSQKSGVYSNAHWSLNSLPMIATGPGQFATTISIESAF